MFGEEEDSKIRRMGFGTVGGLQRMLAKCIYGEEGLASPRFEGFQRTGVVHAISRSEVAYYGLKNETQLRVRLRDVSYCMLKTPEVRSIPRL